MERGIATRSKAWCLGFFSLQRVLLMKIYSFIHHGMKGGFSLSFQTTEDGVFGGFHSFFFIQEDNER